MTLFQVLIIVVAYDFLKTIVVGLITLMSR